MPSGFYVLLRMFVRVDRVLLRLLETRVYHEFGTQYVVRETTDRRLNLTPTPSTSTMTTSTTNTTISTTHSTMNTARVSLVCDADQAAVVLPPGLPCIQHYVLF